MIDINAKDGTPPVAAVLAGLERIVSGSAVAERDIEMAVMTEVDTSTVVIAERIVLGDPENLLAGWISLIRVGLGNGEA